MNMATGRAVLIISKETFVIKMVHVNLEKKYKTTSTKDVEKAIKLLEEGKIGLVVYDIYIPDSETLNVINRIHQCCNTPIIALIGKNEIASLHSTLAAKDEYLIKPFNVQTLLTMIQAKFKDI